MIVAAAFGTGMFLSCLPAPQALQVSYNLENKLLNRNSTWNASSKATNKETKNPAEIERIKKEKYEKVKDFSEQVIFFFFPS